MKLTLGTAQLGMKYGVVNRAGKPSRGAATAMVRRALADGVTTFDTARAYGDAEEVLGQALGSHSHDVTVVTKLHLPELPEDADHATVGLAIEQSVRASLRALDTPRLQVLLLHNWRHYSGWGGAAWQHLTRFQGEGLVDSLGASVYAPAEALAALAEPRIQHLQIPFNVLDWRWKAAGVDRALAQRTDVTVHARSALLQGVLAHPGEMWPRVDGADANGLAKQLEALARQFGRESVTDLCLAYVRSQSWVASVVLGCETIEQLEENLRLFRRPPLSEDQCAELEEKLPRAPEALLDPTRWKVSAEIV